MAQNDKSDIFDQIDSKLDAAKENLKQGELGKEYALQKLIGMKDDLVKDQTHLINEAHLAQHVK